MSDMADLKINTEAVVTAANRIKNCNDRMRDGFPTVQAAINNLNNSWNGAAASHAIGKFNELKSRYPDARYTVLDNYVNFLFQQVGEGYTQSEDANVSLADQFK